MLSSTVGASLYNSCSRHLTLTLPIYRYATVVCCGFRVRLHAHRIIARETVDVQTAGLGGRDGAGRGRGTVGSIGEGEEGT